MKKLKDKNLCISLLITLVFFGIFIKMDYATDTYSVLGSSPKEIFDHFMLSGRFVTAFLWGGVNVLNFGDYLIYFCSFVLAIISITFSIYLLFKLINEKVKSESVSFLVSTLIIINPFSVELFMYIEKSVLALTILLSVLATKKFIEYIKGNKKAIIPALIYMLIATFCYQGVISLFIAISVVFIVLYSKNVKDFIKNNVVMLLCYGIPAVINLLTIRLFFTNERVSGEIILSESLQKIIDGSKTMLATYNILPKYTFVIVLSLLIILAIIMICINKKEKTSTKVLKILGIGYVIIATIGITIVPQIMQNTSSIWFVPRSTYTFASIVGIMCLYILLNVEDKNILKNVKLFKKYDTLYINNTIITIIAVVLLGMQFYSFNKIELDHYNLNYLDKINSQAIGNQIKLYEQETGNKVTKICIYNDMNTSFTYSGIKAIGDINVTGFYPDWSIINMINYYNGLNLTTGEKDIEIEETFKNMDWTNYNDEQIIFIGDTIHYCKF